MNTIDQMSVLKLQQEISALIEQLDHIQDKGQAHPNHSQSLDFVKKVEEMSRQIYLLRSNLPQNHPQLIEAEEHMAVIGQKLLLYQDRKDKTEIGEWVKNYRRVWSENLSLFFVTLSIFIMTGLVGWEIGYYQPDFATLLIPQGFMEQILDHQAWFERLKKDPINGGLGIAINNIMVCIRVFVFGALAGIGGLFLLGYNGIFFGVILGFCYANGFGEALQHFVMGHGPLELSIIVASAFSSFIIGRVFYMRPLKLFRGRFKLAIKEAGYLVGGILPWLLLAAFIEGFFSPWPQISFTTRFFVGMSAAVIFWAWTFWPEKEKKVETA